MTDILPEDPQERASFDRLTERLYNDHPLQHVANILRQSSKAQPPHGTLSKILAICANEVQRAFDKGHQIIAAHWAAFPHFQNGEPVTPEAILKIGREYQDMVMNWGPVPTEITFFDQDGKDRKIVYESGDQEAGIASGWGIPEDADWEARAPLDRPALPPINDDLLYILGQPNFRCGPLAAEYRADGADIPAKAEAEQAFVLHRMLGHYLADPVGWRTAWTKDIEDLLERRRVELEKK